MTASSIAQLNRWFVNRPLILVRFNDGFFEALHFTKRGTHRFTVVRPHAEFDSLKLPTLCLAEMMDGRARHCYVGVVTSKDAVATFESRLTVVWLQELQLKSLAALANKLSEAQLRNAFKRKLSRKRFADCLSPKLSTSIISELAKTPKNKKAIEAAAFHIPTFRKLTGAEWAQADAIKLAIEVFGLGSGDMPSQVVAPEGSDSTIAHLPAHVLEDNVIARDASVIPDFFLISKHATGRAVFEKGNERLIVYTANKGPLEKMLGVDLIYINEVVGNTVMVQYKMLKLSRSASSTQTDWIFRSDPQLKKEVDRMKLPKTMQASNDYRLNGSPFYFKFVKRKGDGISHQSFVISLDHFNKILKSSGGKGPKKGIRISYDALDGAYLRESDLIGLIRSGYIGTHRVESDALNPIIEQVAHGNRALVLAWQKRFQ